MTPDVYTEKIVFNKILKDPGLFSTVDQDFFEIGEVKKIYEISKHFFNKYKESPSREQVKHLIKTNKLEELITLDYIDGLFNINLGDYDDQWLSETVEAWIHWRALNTSLFDAYTYMRSKKVDTENVKDVVDTVVSMIRDGGTIDIGSDKFIDFSDPGCHKSISRESFSTGYSYFDQTLGGGLIPGTLTVFQGAPKSGKSVWLLNIAANAVRMNKNVMIITMELLDYQYLHRLSANLMNVTMKEYENNVEDPVWLKKKIKETIDYGDGFNPFGHLFIKFYPGSTASANDIETFIKKVETTRGIKFDVVVIDYLNIMKNWRNPNSDNTYMKVKQICEDVRAAALRNLWAVVSVTQINRTNIGNSDMFMTDTSESMGLAATVDALYGIIQTELMKAENEYIIKALALRNSEDTNLKKKFSVDYHRMTIKESNEPSYTTNT
jgi:replicative DNA helicase